METKYTQHPQEIISGLRTDILRILYYMSLAMLILRHYRNPLKSLKILKELTRHRREFSGEKIKKMVRVDGKYYWDLYVPGYKSKANDNYILGEANRILPVTEKTNRFINILFAITKRCHLKCEHCFEWDSLNDQETLTLPDINNIVAKFQEKGTAQIQITGGEPLLMVDEIVQILEAAKPATDFWIFTSGHHLTPENAMKLKNAGLTGVVVSLDHYDAAIHNQFRGSNRSFEWAQMAVKNAIEARLVTALSICLSRSFVTESNLMAFIELASKMGVSFIQILEPKAVGHFSGKDVLLKAEHEKILEDFYLKMTSDKKFRKYPILCYHGYYQRKVGCFGHGNRSLYIDTDGDLHGCPFCRTKMGNALSIDLDDKIEQLRKAGCHQYETACF